MVAREQTLLIGSAEQVRNWLFRHQLNINEYRRVSDYRGIQGHKDQMAHLVGEYWKLAELDKIKDYCASHNITLHEVAE